ncbi:glycosyl transferase [Legionella beliardensis]|uniref:Glycosyl transferase n=1 Tax=Legionella beliardensis TaxID=91822 RepID=A0A378I0K0_9GAMM|nr:glycosyltransferase family 39 protein [Legionella beliardensis]STX28240.1 glycosyl transferase [Legionella beliardensis]
MTKLPLQVKNYLFNNTQLFFLLFFLTALLARLYLRSSLLELDEAEQVIWAQQLLSGYPNQPPLYSWLQYCLFQVLGINLISLALLKYTLLLGCLYYYHLICRYYCPNKSLALSATAAWVLISSISMDLLKDNTHSILALLTACMTWYWFITPTKSINNWYIRLGIVIGLGFLSKFNYLIFLVIFLISTVIQKEYRLKLVNWRILITIACILIIIFPYGHWLMHHYQVGLYSTYKLTPQQKTLFDGFINLLGASIFFIMPVLISSYFFFPLAFSYKKTAATDLLLHYHFIYFPILALIILTAGIRNFEMRWLIPILFLSPLLLFSHLKPNSHLTSYTKRFLVFCLLVQLIFLVILSYRSYYGHNKRKSIPIIEIANSHKNNLEQIDSLMSDSHWLLGNMQLQFKSAQPYLYVINQALQSPSGHALILWEGETIPSWAEALIKQFKTNDIRWIKDKKNKKIVAGQALIHCNTQKSQTA